MPEKFLFLNPHKLMRLALLAAILLAVLLIALTVAVVVVRMPDPPEKNPADGAGVSTGDLPPSGNDPVNGIVNDGVTLPETPDAGIAYQDRITFVGDSLTAHLINRGVLTGGTNTKQVWRSESNMINLNSEVTSAKIILPGTGEKMTIAEAAALAKPEIMIITLGTDWGVTYLNEADFKACYTALVKDIQKASPDTTVILQSIFPVTPYCANLTNEKIDICNTWVKAIADACGCPYLDTQSVLKGEDGALPAKWNVGFNNDGIHMTKEAYEVILNYIRTHAYTAG